MGAPSTVTPTDNLKRVVGITKDIVQIMAIVSVSVWATYRFGLFRERIPRGVISHEITHRRLTDNTVHVLVTVEFSNAGRVVWTFESEERNQTKIQLIKPITYEHLVQLHTQVGAGTVQGYQ